jgi:hypothetical protein
MIPTRYLSNGFRVYKTKAGKFVKRTHMGNTTYRPKVTHITKGASKFTVKPHHRVYYGGKPMAKYAGGPRRISRDALLLRRILSHRMSR